MAGLILSALIICYSICFGSGYIPVTLHTCANFLCWWYSISTVFGLCFISIIGFSAFIVSILTDKKEERDAHINIMVQSIVDFLSLSTRGFIYYCSTLLLYQASVVNPANLSEWDINKLVCSGILCTIALIWQSFKMIQAQIKVKNT